jgi:hypothetical protein
MDKKYAGFFNATKTGADDYAEKLRRAAARPLTMEELADGVEKELGGILSVLERLPADADGNSFFITIGPHRDPFDKQDGLRLEIYYARGPLADPEDCKLRLSALLSSDAEGCARSIVSSHISSLAPCVEGPGWETARTSIGKFLAHIAPHRLGEISDAIAQLDTPASGKLAVFKPLTLKSSPN